MPTIGLSITTPAAVGDSTGGARPGCAAIGAADGAGTEAGAVAGVASWGPATAEADLGLALDQVDRRQVVPLHQPDELADRPDVERLGGLGPTLRHAYTPPEPVAIRFASGNPDRSGEEGRIRATGRAGRGPRSRPASPAHRPRSGRRPSRAGRCPARRDDHAGPEHDSDSLRSRGASWMSMPIPWPRPWLKKRPKPASSMTERASASTSRAFTPGRIAAIPRSCAARTVR